MWTWLARFLTAPVVNAMIDAYKAKLAAANSQDRTAADLAAKAITAEIEARKSAAAVLIAEQGRWYTAILRPLLAFPIVIYLWKVIVSFRDRDAGPAMRKRVTCDVISYGEWIRPRMKNFREQCCDCGLIHRLDFKIVEGRVEFRTRRDERATAAARRPFRFAPDAEGADS